jgi:hypothetical protein
VNYHFWKSRSFGPLLTTLVLGFAIVDYSVFVQTDNSLLRPLWLFLGIVSDAVRKLPPISSYVAIPNLLLFGSIALFGILIVVLAIFSARKSMRVLTEKLEQIPPQKIHHPPAPSNAPTESFSEHSMFQWSVPVLRLRDRLVLSFTAIAAVIGFLATFAVYRLSFGVFEATITKRADVIAVALSDVVAKNILEKNLAGLRNEISRSAAQKDVAYIFVEDEKGSIMFSDSEPFQSPQSDSILNPQSKSRWMTIFYKGQPVYETRTGILDGRLGILHLGIWKDSVAEEINNILQPIAISILIAVFTAVIFFRIAAGRIVQPLPELIKKANLISKGHLDTSTGIRRSDEFGEIAVSIERMRASLNSVKKRLDRSQVSS